MKSLVVCAAMRKNGVIVCGARHFDSVMRPIIDKLDMGYGEWEQGFIDQNGHFLTRKEAWKIADENGQIRRGTGWETQYDPRPAGIKDDGVLFSENLY